MGLPWDSASTSTHFFTTTSTTSGFFSASEARVTKNMAKPRGCRSSSCRHFMGRSTGQPFHGDLRWFKHQPSWNSPRNPRIPRCEQWIGEKIKTGNNGCFKLWTMVVIWPSNIFCIYIIIYIYYIYVVSCKLPFKEFSEWEVAKQPNQIQSEWFLVGKNTGKTCPVALVHSWWSKGWRNPSEPMATSCQRSTTRY